ncbi:MAG TPA: hypothetical protein VEI97_19100 [bacterium]|nr:hypothetical protein [bacterium]
MQIFRASALLGIVLLSGCNTVLDPWTWPGQDSVEEPPAKPVALKPDRYWNPACDALDYARLLETDPARLLAAAERHKLGKDEYESRSDYAARTEDVTSILAPYLTRTPLGPRVVLTVPMIQHRVKYSADSQTLRIEGGYGKGWKSAIGIRTNDPITGYESGYTGILHSTTEKVLGTYTKNNSYGVELKITKFTAQRYGLAFSDTRRFEEWSEEIYPLDIPMPPDVAREAVPAIAVRVVAKPESPFILKDKEEIFPTNERPYDGTIDSTYLLVRAECAALVNGDTGALIARLK